MPSSIDILRVNGLMGDPAVYVFFQRIGQAVLLDAGDLTAMSNRDLLKVRLVCVSHTHIDHFIGFDRLIRVNIPHGRVVEVAGPRGIIGNVRGKLLGYTWNLVDAAQIRFVVHEMDEHGEVTSVLLSSDDGFSPKPHLAPRTFAASKITTEPQPPRPPARVVAHLDDGTRLEAVTLDHKTPSLAFACQMPLRYHVRQEALAELGLEPGSWIRDAQIALTSGAVDTPIETQGRRWVAGELEDRLFVRKAPRPFGYLTDAGFTRGNVDRAVALFGGAVTLIAETNYRDAERARALDRMHLTTRQAALIAARAGCSRLETFHVSNIYVDDPDAVVEESTGFFREFSRLPWDALDRLIEAELERR